MSARALCRQVARLPHLPPALRRDFLRAQHLHKAQAEPEPEADKEEGRDVVLSPQEGSLSGAYTLPYNPSSYRRPQLPPGASQGRPATEEDEDRGRPSALTPPFRQQVNPYSVTSSRRISSSRNTLLDLAFNKSPGGGKSVSPAPRSQPLPPGVQSDPRAFQRCRPEYTTMTVDLSRRPLPTIQSKEAFLLLHKVSVMKGSMEPSDVTQILSDLSHLHQDQSPLVRGDTRFIMLLRYSVENLRCFTHQQLLEVVRSFVWLGLPSTHSMLGLYEAELGRRAEEMSLHQLLLAADMWRCLGRAVPQYLDRLYTCASLHLAQVGPAELVQLLYVMGEGRRCPSGLVQPLEHLLTRHLDALRPEEVGAVCLGLFKSQTALPQGPVGRLVDRAHALVAEMSDFSLVNVLKLLRFSHLDHRAWLEALSREVPLRAPAMGVQGLMHVALACSALHYRDDRVLLAVAARLPALAPHCRSKDAAKLLWAFGSLGVPPGQCPAFYASLADALRQREAEFQRYPEHLLTGLLGLAFVCQLPEDLLALALSPEFVSLATRSKQLELRKDLFTLDGTAGLELPRYAGPRLSAKLTEEVSETLWRFAQKDVCQKPEVVEAEGALADLLGGEEFVRKHMILPHTRSIDLEVHLDPKGQPLPVTSTPGALTSCTEWVTSSSSSSSASSPHGWEKGSTGVTLTEDLLARLTNTRKTPAPQPSAPPHHPRPLLRRTEPDDGGGLLSVGVDLTDGLLGALTKRGTPPSPPPPPPPKEPRKQSGVRLAVQVTNRNQYCYRSQQLMGLHALKRRQLELAGYTVVELPHWEWFPLLRRTKAEKLAYLHCKIYSYH